ncbi:MAG: DUF402 domain-containing protein [Acidimicrobiales bacterium]
MARAVGSEVWLERRKYPDSAHYGVQARFLGEDEHGLWAGAAPGHLVTKGEADSFRGQQTVVWCVPRDGWFLAHYLVGHPELEIYIDIAAPAVWNDRGAKLIDLDLDVIVWTQADGRGVELVDEDEFEQHRVELAYPQELIDGAIRAGAEVLAQATAGAAPFTVATAQPWVEALDRLLA